MVLQDPTAALNPKLSIYESVAEGLRVQRYPGDEAERVVQSLVDAELTPPERFMAAIPQELSGGLRRARELLAAIDDEYRRRYYTGIIADEELAGVEAPDTSKTREVLNSTFIQHQTPGQSINDTININIGSTVTYAVPVHFS